MDLKDPYENMSPRALEDYELVRQAMAGDQQSYSALMDRYRSAIFHTIIKIVGNKDDAEDLTIEAFGKAFAKLNTYTPKYAFSTWLFRIATNNSIDYIRKKRLNLHSIDEAMSHESGSEFSESLHSDTLDPEELFIQSQKLKLMRTVLSQLDHKYRLMVELRFFEEMSYEEIAEELEMPMGTVKAQLFRAKEILYELLQAPSTRAQLDGLKRKKK
jgi:RNA polymerase sigma factor (sigma-70 family)